MYADERIGVTRNGKLAAVVVGVEDFEALEEFEFAKDIAAYDKTEDDGVRISHHDLVADLTT